jgi:hypothetical protein
VSRTRPWRATASLRFGPGLRPIVLARTAALTRPGLDRFVEHHSAAGAHVDVWEVLPIPEVASVTQAADSPTG